MNEHTNSKVAENYQDYKLRTCSKLVNDFIFGMTNFAQCSLSLDDKIVTLEHLKKIVEINLQDLIILNDTEKLRHRGLLK